MSSAGSAAERASIDSVGVHTVVSFVHSAAMEQRFARDRRVEMSARERQSAYNSRKVNRSVGDVPGGGGGGGNGGNGGGLTPQSTGYLMKTVSVEEEEVDDALEEEVSSANSRTAILSDDVVSLNTGGGGGRGGDMRGGGDIGGGGGGGGSSSSLTDGTNSFYNAYLAEATSTDQLIGGRGDGGNGDK